MFDNDELKIGLAVSKHASSRVAEFHKTDGMLQTEAVFLNEISETTTSIYPALGFLFILLIATIIFKKLFVTGPKAKSRSEELPLIEVDFKMRQ